MIEAVVVIVIVTNKVMADEYGEYGAWCDLLHLDHPRGVNDQEANDATLCDSDVRGEDKATAVSLAIVN